MSIGGRGVSGVVVLAAVSLCGCGAGSSPARRPASTTTASSASAAAAAGPTVRTDTAARVQRPQPLGPPIGSAQPVQAGGAALTVTVTRLIDPLSGSGAALPAGTRAAGVLVRIANAGPDVYDSSATGDFSLVVSAGVVTAVFVPQGVCKTPLQDFDNYITAGEQRSGCVAFAVPESAQIIAIRFSPHASAQGRRTWRVTG